MKRDHRLLLLAIPFFLTAICITQSSTARLKRPGKMVDENAWETISQSKSLSKADKAALINSLESISHDKSEEKVREITSELQVQSVDLGGKGTHSFVVRATGQYACSPTGNCEVWVLRRIGDKYSVILHRIATQAITIQPTTTNGWQDLVLIQHGSAFLYGLNLYRFNGSKYQFAVCYDESFQVLGDERSNP